MEESKIKEILKSSQKDVRAVYSHLDEKISRAKIEILTATDKPAIQQDARIREEFNGIKETVKNLERDLHVYERLANAQVETMLLLRELIEMFYDGQKLQTDMIAIMSSMYIANKIPTSKFDADIVAKEEKLIKESDSLHARSVEWAKKFNRSSKVGHKQ